MLFGRALRESILDEIGDELSDRAPIFSRQRLDHLGNFRLWAKTQEWFRHQVAPLGLPEHQAEADAQQRTRVQDKTSVSAAASPSGPVRPWSVHDPRSAQTKFQAPPRSTTSHRCPSPAPA